MTKTSRVSKPSTYINTYYFYTHPGTIKFHKIGHWSAWVREFGAPSNYNAETWESAHKWFVKRWIGRVQYNSTGMIAGLLRRNHVAESHRGSNVLDPKLSKKRPRSAYSVLNHIGNSRFKKFFSEADDFWISCGDSIKFGDPDNLSDMQMGKLQEIVHDCGRLYLSIILYERVISPESSGTLDSVTWRLKLRAGPGANVVLEPEESALLVATYCVQPDFENDECVYHCPWMGILT